MKKNFFLVFLLTVLTVSGLGFSHTQKASASIFDDSPDDADGFAAGDPCGFVEGTSTPYRAISIDADGVSPDRNQACADASGYFYEHDYPALSLFSDRDSFVQIEGGGAAAPYSYTVDLVGTSYGALVDQTTGEWSGYGYITDTSYTGKNRWVWFDWRCVGVDSFSGSDATCGGGISSSSYRVTTNLETGLVQGYAWNDDLGFLSFRNLTMELAPHDIEVWVDVLASDTDLGPNAVDVDTAPMADNYDYWRIRVQFWDVTAGEFLDESDFTTGTLVLDPTMIGEVFIDQIEDSGVAPRVATYNVAVGCTDASADYCSMTEDDGSWSANAFAFSRSPTSDMIGLNTDSDTAFENHTDRPGCRWIYRDQWYEVDHVATQKKCPYPGGETYLKDAVFYDRMNNRNMIGLETLGLIFTFASDRNYSVSTDDGTITTVDYPTYTSYNYTPTYNGDYDEDGIDDGLFLSFKPRFTATKFVAIYDLEEHTQISSDTAKTMGLSSVAILRPTSDAAQSQGVAAKPAFDIYYQLDADSNAVDPSINDMFLLMDTADAGTIVDCGRRTDTLSAGTYAGYYSVIDGGVYTMGYGQKSAACQGFATTGPSTNVLSNPTAEQWVCDRITDNYDSCYYTAYLDIVDRHDDPSDHPMEVLGAINSVLNDETVLTNTDDISILGSTETIKMRNKMYAQVVRYMLGQTASSGTLDASMDPSAGLVELMNGRLVVAEGDVTVEGSSAFSDKTLVVIGGNVYIDGDITGGRLGVIALRSGGVGGNVLVAPDVTDLYANFFLDGAFYSYNGVTTYTEEPSWTSDENRIESLYNQLYLNGSLVSRNTVNGADNSDADGIYDVGDGTTTTNYAIAREHDLNMIRQFRLCYPLDATGLPDTTVDPSRCNEGESLSATFGDSTNYSSFILEYAPADSLPIFRSQN